MPESHSCSPRSFWPGWLVSPSDGTGRRGCCASLAALPRVVKSLLWPPVLRLPADPGAAQPRGAGVFPEPLLSRPTLTPNALVFLQPA